MHVADLVSAAVVNFQTPDLIVSAAQSFHRCYPDVKLLVVENGSQDESPRVIRRMASGMHGTLDVLALEENCFHGPALDLALRRLETPYVFVFDSDTETRGGGFLEQMVVACEPEDVYGAGKVVHANRRGFVAGQGTPVLASASMLLKRDVYLRLPPFVHHGLPTLHNFQAAAERGYRLIPFPIDDYVAHFGRGTAERYGYGLGIRGRVNYLLNKLGW